MADKKISQLPPASTPLAGTEVLPIVQSGTTDQVSIANITAGRVPAMNNAAMGYTAVTSAAGTTTLTATSNHIQKLTGSAAQTFKLPDATTITAGTAFLFDNDSTGLLTVIDNASGAVTTVASGSSQYVFLETAGTAAGSWGKYAWIGGAGALSVTAAKTASITNSLTLSGTDSTTMTFPTTSATIARTDAANTFTGNQTVSGKLTGNSELVVTGANSGHAPSRAVIAYSAPATQFWSYGNAAGTLGTFNWSSRSSDASLFSTPMSLDGAGNLTTLGNVVIGTSGKGIDFSVTPDPAGMTSELLADYEEGTWTPNQGSGLTLVGAFTSSGQYTKVGRLVWVRGYVNGATSVAVAAAGAVCTNLPYTVNQDSCGSAINSSVNLATNVYVYTTTVLNTTATPAGNGYFFSVTYMV